MGALTININGRACIANKGQTLLEVINGCELTIDAPCGGKMRCKKCKVLIKSKDSDKWIEGLACQIKVNEELDVKLSQDSIKKEVIVGSGYNTLSSNDEKEQKDLISKENYVNLGLAVDIGTTTVVLCLIDLERRRVLIEKGFANPQRAFGADVTSRISYCKEQGQTGILRCQQVLIHKINKAINEMKSSILTHPKKSTLEKAVIVGNATMLHLLRGLSPISLGEAPYKPLFKEQVRLKGKELGIMDIKDIILLPSVSAFIGADILAGIGELDISRKAEISLMLDLGTNGEMIMGNKHSMMACSTAVGPAFEGVNMSQGMPALDGAIYAAYINESGIGYKVVNDVVPKGICGSGYVDLIALLLQTGEMDSGGLLQSGEANITDGICITQEDIRQFQMAKAAVHAGIKALIEAYGLVDIDLIDKIYIAGGIGNYLNTDHAVRLNMLPSEVKDKITVVGNVALKGAIGYLLNKEAMMDIQQLPSLIKVIDLATDEYFKQEFVKKMLF